jgi:uncharacterized protein (TIGR00661 family)
MKIFYAVQATGNGHISRAMEILPVLEKMGQVDIFLSGSNASLPCSLPVRFRSTGLSLFYSRCGGLDFKRTWRSNSILRAKRESLQLPVENYDVVINDFEYITAQACAIKNIPSVQFGHQASFMSDETPRPSKKNIIGEMVLKKYAPASSYIGLHFKRYAPFIFPPVIKSCFLNSNPKNLGHITVYLPAYKRHCIEEQLSSLTDLHFHWFLEGITGIYRDNNITYFPVDKDYFNESLLNCHGIITGGGFETPAEAMYLGKRLLSIPIRAQYEQQCNATALSGLGIPVLNDAATPQFPKQIMEWLSNEQPVIIQEANNLKETITCLFDHYPSKKEMSPNKDFTLAEF